MSRNKKENAANPANPAFKISFTPPVILNAVKDLLFLKSPKTGLPRRNDSEEKNFVPCEPLEFSKPQMNTDKHG